MGGNMRHANKGTDRPSSNCADCGQTFTHHKFSHPNYCQDCRAEKRDEAQLETNVEISDLDEGFEVNISIINENDVSVKIPVDEIEDSLGGILGYIRVVGDSFVAEDAVIGKFEYSVEKVRKNSEVSYQFKWNDGSLDQQDKPRVKFNGVIGEDVRDEISITRGDPEEEDELAVMFSPVEASTDYLHQTYDGTS